MTGAVPVLADPSTEDSTPSDLVLVPAEPIPFSQPDAEDTAAAMVRIEEEEEQRERELKSPAAAAQREASRSAYEDHDSVAEVGELLRTFFAAELASVDLDPARVITDSALKRGLDGEGAVVSREGRTELIEADIPAKVPDEDGEPRKVDLSLEATAKGFEPENPILDMVIATAPDEGVSLEGGETTIVPVGVDPKSEARLFGEKDVLYPDVHTDTDLMVAPLSNGVELFDLLRSSRSPEEFRFELDVPKGAELRENAGSVEVYEGEKFSAAVMPPHAIDAQGTLVPVEMELEGATIVLTLTHREGDYAYPILLDPEYVQNDWVNSPWYGGNNYHVLEDGTFQTWWNNSKLLTNRWCINHCWGSGRGLFVSAPSGSYSANQQAHWTYTPPGETSFLNGYLINPFFRWDTENQACWSGPHPNPHDFDGLWSPAYQIYYQLYTNRALYTNASIYGNTAKTAKVMVFGLNTGNSANNPCWRDLYAGGIATYMTDPDWPTLDPPSGLPSGWFDDTKEYELTVSAHDKGLGVKNIWLVKEGNPLTPLETNDCLGTHGSPCYSQMSGEIPFNGDLFDEGKTLIGATAQDALARAVNSQSWWAYVDNSSPKVTLDGQLAKETGEEGSKEQPPGKNNELSLPVYNLKIKAEDGSNTANDTMRSGIKTLEVLLDESQTPLAEWTKPSCPASSCSMEKTFQLKLHDLAPGEHTLRVIATDQLDHLRERKIEFEYIPATGKKDEYAMHYFPLPDGLGDEDAEEFPDRPELAVNLMNGNLVYREQDVEVEGYAVDLEVERYYNSQLPEAEDTEWGDGWTLAQTPELEPEEGQGPPEEAELLASSGALEDGVELPTEVGGEAFDPALRATIEKQAGGYELTDETGASSTSVAFDESGRTTELRTEGYAKIAYDYEAGELAEIAVQDPGAASEAEPPVLPEPLPDPIAAYSFDEGEGSVLNDSTEGNHDGTISGATWSEAGKYGGALSFDGSDDVVTVPDHSDLDLTDSFTLEAWVRPDPSAAISQNPISKVDYAASSVGYALRSSYAGNPAGHAKSSAGAINAIAEDPLPEKEWSHLAFTSDGTTLRLYVDGELVKTAAAKVPPATSADLKLGYGKALGVDGYFDGLLDEVRLYGEPLSPEQIAVRGEAPEEEPSEPDDPSVQIETEGGLVESLEGARAGEHTYEHEGDLLISHEGPEGKTAYEYDSEGSAKRLTKVTLANGTWAEIKYNETYGRVKSVTVDPAGEEGAKTTYFEFQDEPRRTIVTPPGEPVVTYDIGDDGSILRWRNAIVPPEIHLTGSIDFNKGKPGPISTGTHNLVINAYSEEGISSIQLVANGDTLVDEMSCEQDFEKPGVECVEVLNEWVTETQNHAPGILHLEAVVEDRLGQIATERLWVNIPEPPPPPPAGAPVAPKFVDVLRFREERGLDLDLDPVHDEERLNDRVFNTINDWTQGNPVARASWERWGVPLRTPEVAELEYRIAYQARAAEEIPAWAQAHAAGTYAGLYIDERAGGLVRVGFKGDSTGSVLQALKSASGNSAAGSRFAPFADPPGHSLAELENLETQIYGLMDADPSLPIHTVATSIDDNLVRVEAANVQQVTAALTAAYGGAAPFSISYSSARTLPRAGRERKTGPIQAGDRYVDDNMILGDYCTAGFGAWERGRNPVTNEIVNRYFMLSAGHCVTLEVKARRRGFPNDNDTHMFGRTTRHGLDTNASTWDTDGAAIKLGERSSTPRHIYTGEGYAIPIKDVVEPRPGMEVCQSGVTSNFVRRGRITNIVTRIEYDPTKEEEEKGEEGNEKMLQVVFDELTLGGDSGSPVWQCGTHNALGLLTGGDLDDETEEEIAPSYFTPLLQTQGRIHMPGVFRDPDLAPLHLFTAE